MSIEKASKPQAPVARALRLAQRVEQLLEAQTLQPAASPRAALAKALARSLIDEIALIA
jgi:hypothetical protein